MKHILISFLLFLIFTNITSSQDLIVTNDGDSINCKITKKKGEYIYFIFKYENKEVRKTLINLNQIKYYQSDYYSKANLNEDELKSSVDYSEFRFGISGGYSYRIAKIDDKLPSLMKDYIQNLKSGYCLGADMYYFTSENIGFGLKYSYFNSKNQMSNISLTYPDGQTRYGDMSSNISIHTICPSVATRFSSQNNTNSFISGFSVGYQSYNDKAKLIDGFTITGNTVGLIWDFGYDQKINQDLAVNYSFSYLVGTLSKYTKDDGRTKETVVLEKESFESLARIELTIGLKLTK